MSELCPHNRLTTAYCQTCAEADFPEPEKPAGKFDKKVMQPEKGFCYCKIGAGGKPCVSREYCDAHGGTQQYLDSDVAESILDSYTYGTGILDVKHVPNKDFTSSGLDAPYYDFPATIKDAMDLIEWLDLDFSNGNVLKSLIREHNPDAKKKSTQLYEAEKRVYYATRHLRRVREVQEKRSGGE